ncbi:MAG: carboxypeptidase regulatory-like domain-containing protein [Phycisphaerae bacterium]|nr:carboxypeptidase regulatory-like domain-containing protein [Phycisphaerae bacterium]
MAASHRQAWMPTACAILGVSILAAAHLKAQQTDGPVIPVPSTAGETPPGASLAMDRHIQGRVTGPDGLPLAGAVVSVFSRYETYLAPVAIGETDGDGRYDIGALPSGLYAVEARGGAAHPSLVPMCYDRRKGSYTLYNRNQADETLTELNLLTGDADGVDFHLQTIGGAIEGRVTQADGVTSAADLVVVLFDEQQRVVDSGTTDAYGRFALYGVRSGRYLLEYGLLDDSCYDMNTYDSLLGQIWYDDNAMLATWIDVKTSVITAGVDGAFMPGGVISGKVTAADGVTPIEGVSVEAISPVTWRARGTRATGPDGTYTICGLMPGEHIVQACPAGGNELPYQCQVYADVSAMEEYCADYSQATLISLGAGDVVEGVDFALVCEPEFALSLRDPIPPASCYRGGDMLTVEWPAGLPTDWLSLEVLSLGASYCGMNVSEVAANEGFATITLPDDFREGQYVVKGSYGAWCERVRGQTEPFCVARREPPATLTIIEPTGDRCLQAGSRQVIRWMCEGVGGSVYVMILREPFGFLEWGSVPASAGQYAWTVPYYCGDEGEYRAVVNAAGCSYVGDQSDPFCITGSLPLPHVTLTAPNGDEVFTLGAAMQIQWTVDPPGIRWPMHVYLYKAGLGVGRIAEVDVADGELQWSVSPFVEAGDDYTIVLSPIYRHLAVQLGDRFDVQRSEESDGQFSIVGETLPRPLITITSPSGLMTSWFRGAQECVTWEAESSLDLEGLNAVVYFSEDMFENLTAVGSGPLTGGQVCLAVPCGEQFRSGSVYVGVSGDVCDPTFETSVPVYFRHTPGYVDFDCDGDVDLADFAVFQACFRGENHPYASWPAAEGCERADADSDDDVDLDDFRYFLTCFSGPNRPPTCEW